MGKLIAADVSRWQGPIDWAQLYASGQVQVAVIKVGGADGGLYVDGMFARNRDEARRVGMPVWFYWYKSGSDAVAQADYMVRAIGELRDGEAIVLDDENEAAINMSFCTTFADRIKETTGRTIVVYSNQARFMAVDLTALKNRNVGAWVAKYGNNNGTLAGAGQAPSIPNLSVIMWQYTSAARVPGITENTVDMNVFYGDVEAWRAYGNATSEPHATPSETKPVAASSGDGTYTVVSGDTLSGIGAKVGLDWHIIAANNGIVEPWTIWPGQVLAVYGGSATAASQPVAGGVSYTVVAGDTLSGIGAKTGCDWRDIAALNKLKAPYLIYPGQKLLLSGNADSTPYYTVVPGDNLSLIGEKTGRDWQVIARANGLSAPYTIYPNQVLRLA